MVWEDYELVVAGGAGWEERLAAWNVAIVVVQAADEAFRGPVDRGGLGASSTATPTERSCALRRPRSRLGRTRTSGPGRSPGAVLVGRRRRPDGIVGDHAASAPSGIGHTTGASAASSTVNQLMFTTGDPSSIVTTATE